MLRSDTRHIGSSNSMSVGRLLLSRRTSPVIVPLTVGHKPSDRATLLRRTFACFGSFNPGDSVSPNPGLAELNEWPEDSIELRRLTRHDLWQTQLNPRNRSKAEAGAANC